MGLFRLFEMLDTGRVHDAEHPMDSGSATSDVAKGVVFTREELALLHEALSYALKRTFSEGEKARLRDLVGRVEDRVLAEETGAVRPLSMTEPEYQAIVAAAETFCGALDGAFAAAASRDKAHRVRGLVARFNERGPRSWFRRLWRRS
jgi:hypothetical protein